MELNGTTALVTGANRGMGLEFARTLAGECEKVYAGVRDPSKFKSPAPNIEAVRIDLSSQESIDLSFAESSAELATVDVLVNNAGLLSVGLLEEQELDKIYASLQVNLVGLIHLTKLMLPAMLERDSGFIVNNASISGYAYFPLATVYAAGKSGVVAFSESLRRELAPTGVNVMHLITPGVETDMLDATAEGYGDHFDTSGWDTVTPAQWAAKMLEGIKHDRSAVQPGGKTRMATLLSRGPSSLLDSVAGRMYKR